MTIKSTLPVVTGVLIAWFAAAALADVQIKGATAPTIDPRRAQSGATVTAEADPGSDTTGAQDSQRVADSYRPKGIGLGLFLLMPKLEIDESYNTNIYATHTDIKTDLVSTIRPDLTLRSRFDKHELNFHLSAEEVLYKAFDHEDHLELAGDVSGRYDLTSGTELNGFAQLYSRHEDRTSPDDKGGLRPTPTKGFAGKFGGKTESGPFTMAAEIAPQRMTFEEVATSAGSVVPNGDRNRWELEGKVRTSYEVFPGYAAVTQFSGNTRQYDQTFDRSGYQRSSSGYRAEAGVGFDISQLLRGDFLLGYLAQDYRDSRFTDPHGLSFRSSLNWTPDKLTIVVPAIERSVAETTTAAASSLVRNSASVLVRHEMARNIMLSAYGSVAYEELSGLHQSDWLYEGRLKGTYAFGPKLYVGAEAAFRDKEAVVESSSYRQAIFTLRLGLQL